MKLATIALTTALISFSSFASTVNCNIYSKDKSGNWDQVDSITLGSTRGGYVQEAGNEIKGLKGKFINVMLGGSDNNATASIDILDGGPRLQGGKMILSAQGSLENGLSGAAYSEGISYLCTSK